MQKTEKKQLRNWLRIGSINCRVPRLTTPYPPHSLINLTVDIGREWNRRRPLPIPKSMGTLRVGTSATR